MEVRLRFKHLMPAEVALWERWLEEYSQLYDKYSYDVHVGTLPELPADAPPNIKAMAEAAYLKRIDVVAENPEHICIFEIKPFAGFTALGQLLGYDYLYNRDLKPGKTIKLACVTNFMQQDIKEVMGVYKIKTYIV